MRHLILLSGAAFTLVATTAVRPVTFSEAQVARGAEVFVAQCAGCHGAQGEEAIDHGPILAGPEFWTHWNGRPMRALYSRIISTMPANEPGILEPQDVLDVTAYLAGVQPKGAKPVTNADALNSVVLRNPDANN